MPTIAHGNWTHRSVMALVLHGRAGGSEVINVHHFEATIAGEGTFISDGLAAASANDVRDDWIANAKTTFLAQFATGYTLEGVGAQVIERPATLNHKLGESVTTLIAANVGTQGVSSMPLTTCSVTRWRSLLATRHGHGRSYFSPLDRNRVSESDPPLQSDATGLALYRAYADLMLARYGDSGAHTAVVPWDFTVYNRPYDSPKGAYARRIGGVLTVVNDAFAYDGDVHHIETVAVDPILRSQRRRESGVGA